MIGQPRWDFQIFCTVLSEVGSCKVVLAWFNVELLPYGREWLHVTYGQEWLRKINVEERSFVLKF